MRVMLMIKGDPQPGAAPSEELLVAMGRYNDELKTAGVLLDLAGLLPSAEGRRVKFSGGDRAVIDGPFPESRQLIARNGRFVPASCRIQLWPPSVVRMMRPSSPTIQPSRSLVKQVANRF